MCYRSTFAPLRTLAVAGAAVAALSACEQTEQTLPFDTSTDPVSRAIPASGGVVSTAAGASFMLPAGSVPGGTTVTVTVTPNPAAGAAGAPAAPHSFSIAAGGVSLARPIDAEFRFARQDAQAWLASAVVVTPQGTVEMGEADVDIAAGILRAKLPAFGTVTPVFPAQGAVVAVGQIAAAGTSVAEAPAAVGSASLLTRGLRGECGTPQRRCTDLQVSISRNLFQYASAVSAVFPIVSGQIDFAGTGASGSLALTSPLRLRLHSGAAAVTIPVRVSFTPTAQTVVAETPGTITLSNVRVRVESSQGTTEETMPLTVTYTGTAARLTIQRNIGANLAGVSETSAFRATIPLTRIP
jgi:hypothetical protein